MSLEGLLLKIMIDEIGGNILPPVEAARLY
jgi:hypothetical protein